MIDPVTGRIDTLRHFRRTIEDAQLEAWVIAIVGASHTVAAWWRTSLSLLFIDGGHTEEAAHADYTGFAPLLRDNGVLVLHDVFPDPAAGGQAPFHVYERALQDGYHEVAAEGSMRVVAR